MKEEQPLGKPVASSEQDAIPMASFESKVILGIWTAFFFFLVGLIVAQEPPKMLKMLWVKMPFFRVMRDTLIEPIRPMNSHRVLEVYQQAYPDFIAGVDSHHLIWRDSTKMLLDDGMENKSFESLLNHPDLEDQLCQQYPLGSRYHIKDFQDPGRIRYEPFFKKMYGANPQQVSQHLVTIRWLPKSLNIALKVTKINGIDQKLQQISNELGQLPHLRKYLENPGGTFNWRNIAGTNRLSTHSFGATIDINVQYSHYWKWDFDKYGRIHYQNLIPLEIVEIFEKHGFIWGGKWYHYDTMHFEYRPELILSGKKEF